MTHIYLRAMIGAPQPSGIAVVHQSSMPTFRRDPSRNDAVGVAPLPPPPLSPPVRRQCLWNDWRTTPPTSAHQVVVLILPLGGSPCRRWRSFTAVRVAWSYSPVGVTSA